MMTMAVIVLVMMVSNDGFDKVQHDPATKQGLALYALRNITSLSCTENGVFLVQFGTTMSHLQCVCQTQTTNFMRWISCTR